MAVARAPELAERLRAGSDAEAAAIVDELLRIDDPFVSNRRVTTCPVTLAGREIAAGERVLIHWTSVNRDERVFPDPDAFRPERFLPDQDRPVDPRLRDFTLPFGFGRRLCPGMYVASQSIYIVISRCVLVSTKKGNEAIEQAH